MVTHGLAMAGTRRYLRTDEDGYRQWSFVEVAVAAIGAAVAVTLGGGGLFVANATSGTVSSFVPVVPCRLADTRPVPWTVGPRSTPLRPAEIASFSVHGTNGRCTIPSTATGISANVTVTSPSESGYLTLFPGGSSRPNSANVNWVAGQAPTGNAVTVGLGSSGIVSAFNAEGSVNVIIDINGYYVASTSGPAGPPGPPGADGTPNRISDEQIAELAWYEDPGATATIPNVDCPQGVAFDGTYIWVANCVGSTGEGGGTVSKINRATSEVEDEVEIPNGNNPQGVAFDGTSIWVTNAEDEGLGTPGEHTVSRIDTTSDTVTATINVTDNPRGVASDGTNIWVASYGDPSASGTMSKIDPSHQRCDRHRHRGFNPGRGGVRWHQRLGHQRRRDRLEDRSGHQHCDRHRQRRRLPQRGRLRWHEHLGRQHRRWDHVKD